MQIRKAIPSPAMAVALAALLATMSGAALALPGKSQVDKNDIKRNAVSGKQVKKNSLTGKDIKEASLGTVPESAATKRLQVFGGGPFVRVTASAGADEDAARAAATEVPLASKGAFDVYGKCFFDELNGDLHGEVFIRTRQDGAIFESRDSGDSLEGGATAAEFLNTNTDEEDAQIEQSEEPTADDADVSYDDEEAFFAAAPDGTQLHGLFETAVKNGALAEGNGIYGDGNVCIFTGHVIG
jgi:hypothetical protein